MVNPQALPVLRLTLVGRSYCSLCDKMRDALQAYVRGRVAKIDLEIVDLEDFPEHEAQYGELVPVLLAGDLSTGHEICHYHFDEAMWNQWISLNAPYSLLVN